MSMSKIELLRRLPAGRMRAAHRSMTVRFIRESVSAWENADEVDRSDIMAFFTSSGPEKIAAVLSELQSF